MNQLSFDFDTTKVVSYLENYVKTHQSISDNFTVVSVYDRLTSSQQTAIQYNADWPEVPVRICFNIIPNSTATLSGYLYLDTIYGKDLVLPAKQNYLNGAKLEVMSYMNFSNELLVKNIAKNLRTILNAYYINNTVFQNIPSATDELPEWVKFDPSLNMFFIKSDFVLQIDHDYTNTPTCYYRSDSNGKNPSNLYKYANRSSFSTCSHELLEKDAAARGSVARCGFINSGSIIACSFYKEDKFKLLTTEFRSKHDETLVVRKIECYLVREILDESYALVFEETDIINGKKSFLKKFSYGNILIDKIVQKDQFILEASKQNLSLISDYTSDYSYEVINHIQSAVELKQKPTVETKVSYLSKLVSQS